MRQQFREIILSPGRKLQVYAGLLLLVGIGSACLAFLVIPDENHFYRKLLLAAIFLGMGIFNIMYAPDTQPGKHLQKRSLAFSILVAGGLLTGLLILSVGFKTLGVMLSMACTSLFLLPSLLKQQWLQLSTVEETRYPAWYLPEGGIDKRATIALNSIEIRIQIAPSYFSTNLISETSIEPSRGNLGKIFHRFIEVYNMANTTMIEREDEDGHAYGWEFYADKLKGVTVRYLDPEKTLIENGVNNKSIITARRVKA